MNAKTSSLSLVALFSLVVGCFGTGCSASTLHARGTYVDARHEPTVALDRATTRLESFADARAIRR
jgi:hypothetical protein